MRRVIRAIHIVAPGDDHVVAAAEIRGSKLQQVLLRDVLVVPGRVQAGAHRLQHVAPTRRVGQITLHVRAASRGHGVAVVSPPIVVGDDLELIGHPPKLRNGRVQLVGHDIAQD